MTPEDFKKDEEIVVRGAGRHSKGKVSGPPRQIKGAWFIQYRSAHNGGERLAPFEQVSRPKRFAS